jgi:hypothetical protein
MNSAADLAAGADEKSVMTLVAAVARALQPVPVSKRCHSSACLDMSACLSQLRLRPTQAVSGNWDSAPPTPYVHVEEPTPPTPASPAQPTTPTRSNVVRQLSETLLPSAAAASAPTDKPAAPRAIGRLPRFRRVCL